MSFRAIVCVIILTISYFVAEAQNKVQLSLGVTHPIIYYPQNPAFFQLTRKESFPGIMLGVSHDLRCFKFLYLRNSFNVTNYNKKYKEEFFYSDLNGNLLRSNHKVWELNTVLEFSTCINLSFNYIEFGTGIQYGYGVNSILLIKDPPIIDGQEAPSALTINYYNRNFWSIPVFVAAKLNRYTIFSMVTLALDSRLEIEEIDEEYFHIYRVGIMMRLGKISTGKSIPEINE